ncbi:hypothetical protein PZB74_15245 [Porifericola rhodea]|uniref:hypothetical protein n=1 Tax=Porifericola rhodea TaxID=930972 RepID=UPI0026657249|nr:hypothetical protein [Porifericola rhodea]WKN30319.1 hypothetical protein PZB74_15245 [Porifericola rhodea]
MTNRIVLSSDHVDSHGDVMTKAALESVAKIINGDRKVRCTVDHKRDLPSWGKLINARVEEIDGHYYLTAEQIEYDIYEDVDWNKDLIKASCSHNEQPFNDPDFDIPASLELSADPQNFRNYSEFRNYFNFIKSSDVDIKTQEFGRKALINDPEVVLRIAEYYFIYKLLKPTIDKTTKKISDKISDNLTEDTVKLYDFIKKSIKKFMLKAIPKNRPINYVIKLPGNPEIELFANITDAEKLIGALKPSKLKKVRDEIDQISENVLFEKIQFTLTEKGKWKFNFLQTDKGETIGRKTSFKKRDHLLELVKKKEKNKHNNA